MPKPFLLCVVWLILTSLTSLAQDGAIWRGLVFDASTVESTIAEVGKPKKIKTENLSSFSSISSKAKGDTRVQTVFYEKIDGWEKVALSFYDKKLFRVKFWPRNKTVLASSLTKDYRANFVSVEGFSKNVGLTVFDGQKEPTVPRVYPTVYFMVSSRPDRFIVASINNGSFKALMKEATNKPTDQMFPGFVEDIEILYRKVEEAK